MRAFRRFLLAALVGVALGWGCGGAAESGDAGDADGGAFDGGTAARDAGGDDDAGDRPDPEMDAGRDDAGAVDAAVSDAGGGAGDATVSDAGGGAVDGGLLSCMAPAGLTPTALPAGRGTLAWSVSLSGSLNYWLFTADVDDSGTVYIGGKYAGTGSLAGTALPEATTYDNGIVAAIDAAGSLLWTRVLESPRGVHVTRVAVHSGRVYVAGEAWESVDAGGGPKPGGGARDPFLVALDAADGSHLWSRAMGGPADEYTTSMEVGPAGNVWITGHVHATLFEDTDLGGGTRDNPGSTDYGFVAGYDSSGAHRFDHVMLDRGELSIVAGSTFVAGRVRTSLTLGSLSVTARDPDPYCPDIWLAELGTDGTPLRLRAYGAAGCHEHPGHLRSGPGGSFRLPVFVRPGLDLGTGAAPVCGGASALLALDSDLAPLLLAPFTDSVADEGGSAIADNVVPHGTGFIAAGFYIGDAKIGTDHVATSGITDNDAFIAGVSSDGTVEWMRRWGSGASRDSAREVVAASASRVYVTARSSEPVDLGSGTAVSAGSHLLALDL